MNETATGFNPENEAINILEVHHYTDGDLILNRELNIDPDEFMRAKPWDINKEATKRLGSDFNRPVYPTSFSGIDIVVKENGPLDRRGLSHRLNKMYHPSLENPVKADDNKNMIEDYIMGSSPSNELGIAAYTKSEYEKRYGKVLCIEEPVAAFIDKKTNTRYLMFKRIPGENLGDFKSWTQMGRLKMEIEDLGIFPDDFQMVTFKTFDDDGKPVFTDWIVDTQNWKLRKQNRTY